MGADIDARVISRGRVMPDGRQQDIFSNFRQYGLPWPMVRRRYGLGGEVPWGAPLQPARWRRLPPPPPAAR